MTYKLKVALTKKSRIPTPAFVNQISAFADQRTGRSRVLIIAWNTEYRSITTIALVGPFETRYLKQKQNVNKGRRKRKN